MPAVSKAQQRFMGMVHAADKGETPASPEVAKVSADMKDADAKDFASTKHDGLPDHVKEQLKSVVREVIREKNGMNEMSNNDVHFKHIMKMYDRGGSFTKKKIGAVVCKDPKASRKDIEEVLFDSDYRDIIEFEDELGLKEIREKYSSVNEEFKHVIHVDTPTQVVSKPVAAQIMALAKKGVRASEIGLEMGFVGNAKLAADTFQKVKNKIYFELDKRNESVNEDGKLQGGEKDPCWKGYEMIGMKPGKGGAQVPNCVPKNESVIKENILKEDLDSLGLLIPALGALIGGGLAQLYPYFTGSPNIYSNIKDWWNSKKDNSEMNKIANRIKNDPDVQEFLKKKNKSGWKEMLKKKLTGSELNYLNKIYRSRFNNESVNEGYPGFTDKKVDAKVIADRMRKHIDTKGFADKIAKMGKVSQKDLDTILPDYVTGGTIEKLFKESVTEGLSKDAVVRTLTSDKNAYFLTKDGNGWILDITPKAAQQSTFHQKFDVKDLGKGHLGMKYKLSESLNEEHDCGCNENHDCGCGGVHEHTHIHEDLSADANGIAGLTASRASAVKDFLEKNNINSNKLYLSLKKGNLKDRMDFVTALVGKPGNPIQKKVIKQFSN